MKLPLTWLKEFVPVRAGADEIARRLTMAGFEVEGIATVEGEPVLEVAVTPNRGDCLSILGMAREVSAIFGIPLRSRKKEKSVQRPVKRDLPISVRVIAPKKCPRYSLAVIPAVKIAPSPDWLVRRLSLVGIRSINNIVDITNYVLMELGQPLHAFDLRKIRGGKIVVRVAKKGETLLTLDGEERLLEPADLLIADVEGPIALAGIMGGENSEISEATESVAIESACFEATGIRRTSHRLGLQSESSYRFERGVDPEGVVRALERVVQLIGGEAAPVYQDLYKHHEPTRRLSFSPSEVGSYLGGDWPPTVIKKRLEGLSFRVKAVNRDRWHVTIPSYRRDIVGSPDLIEEVVRLAGIDKVPVTFPPLAVAPASGSPSLQQERRLKRMLSDLGFHEVIHFSFLSPEDLSALDPALQGKAVAIQNPLGQEYSLLRPTLIPSLLKSAAFHHRHKVAQVRLFEFRKRFERGSDGITERKTIAGLVSGERLLSHWSERSQGTDLFDLKGVVERIIQEFRITGTVFEPGHASFLHPGKQATIRLKNKSIGIVGEVHPDVMERFELKNGTFVFELDWEFLQAYTLRDLGQSRYEGWSLQPVVHRDLALVVDEERTAGSILDFIRQQDSSIRDVSLFDLYRGAPIPAGKKGLGFSLRLSESGRTLTEEEVNAITNRVVQGLREQFGAETR